MSERAKEGKGKTKWVKEGRKMVVIIGTDDEVRHTCDDGVII